MNPPRFPYPGGKAMLAMTIVSFLPATGNTFADVFAGRGNVYFAAASTLQYSNWVVNDIRTAPFFESLKAVGNTVEVPERTRDNAYQTKNDYRKYRNEDSHTARILEPFLTYSGAGYHTAGPRGAGGGPGAPYYRKVCSEAWSILNSTNTLITSLDYLKVLATLNNDDVAFVDPPYDGYDTNAYSDDDIDHRQLVKALQAAPYRWILSEYRNDLYVGAFGEPFWSKDVHRSCNPEGGRRVECMWKNF